LIRPCQKQDIERMYFIINEAARAYDGSIPADCYHQPYMPLDELRREIERMTFFGWELETGLVGVMGSEPVKDVTLIRHAYVLPDQQNRGVGSRLLRHIMDRTTTARLLVGTWADARWAIDFYKKHGFQLLPDKDKLLTTYWDIPPRQVETSVVLGIIRLPSPSGTCAYS
jgi:GNAT superfamily N-acetyltransferase